MLSELEKRLGYVFRDKSLLQTALTHSSYANEHKKSGIVCNERLEFLGDSILGFVAAEYLYRRYPDHPEGEMTKMRADMVCETSLAAAATQLKLGAFLRLGNGEEQGGGRTRSSIIADAMESVIAAAYLDGGFSAAKGIIDRMILVGASGDCLRNVDFKTTLQELVQQRKNQMLEYKLTGTSGPDHNKQFAVDVCLNGEIVGSGVGRSKKRAEQTAAQAAIDHLFPDDKN